MTPKEKYMTDPHYKAIVDQLTAHILQGSFSPSELREAAIFANIRYIERTGSPCINEHLKMYKFLDGVDTGSFNISPLQEVTGITIRGEKIGEVKVRNYIWNKLMSTACNGCGRKIKKGDVCDIYKDGVHLCSSCVEEVDRLLLKN